ncbi:L,D-transpeptidase [Streptomyces mashuensis]|uniref:L,D-transpeptidase n=1 Tax=Streptomyces mashuensis TaxID=33904 RepID=UPI00167C6521|nr:L,D-transpeptidase [Streptomyces mashuensis]
MRNAAVLGCVAALAAVVGPGARAAEPAAGGTQLRFEKNHADQTDSRLLLVDRRTGQVLKSYRAGSGTTQDACASSRGWLPDGTYRVRFHATDYNAHNPRGRIFGYVLRIDDKRCRPDGTGTKRTELFVHSEMKPDGTQGTTEPQRWDGPSDYRSEGCVKLRPQDIKDLFTTASRTGWPTTLDVVG